MLVCPADFKSVWRVLILSAVSSILTRSRKNPVPGDIARHLLFMSVFQAQMKSLPHIIALLLLPLVSSSLLIAQVDNPFTPDEHTCALWHMDQSEPDSLWAVTFGGEGVDICRHAINTSDGAFVAVGNTTSFGDGDRDIWVQKLDDEGEAVWSHTYGAELDEYCYDILELDNGNLALAGSVGEHNREDFLLLVINQDGDSLWSETYGGMSSEICNVIIADDGGFLLGGSTRSYGEGLTDMWVVKVDSSGEVRWEISAGGDRTESCYDIVKAEDGGYLLGGYTTSGINGSDGWLVKLDERGHIDWDRRYGGIHSDRIKSLLRSEDGYICAGYNYANFWLFEIDGDGEVIWDEVYGGIVYYNVYDLIRTVDHGYLLAGAFYNDNGDFDLGVMKTASEGRRAWMRSFGGEEDDRIYSVVQTDDFGYMFFGSTESFGEGEEDWLIMRTAADLIVTGDVSGNANHCRIAGEADTTDGRWGEALYLMPDSFGSIILDDNETIRPRQLTVEGWFFMSDSVRQTGALVTKLLEVEYASYMLYASNVSNEIGFLINTENREYALECDADPGDSAWHYIAATYDGRNMRLFYDGLLRGEQEAEGALLYDDGMLVIGSNDYVRHGDFQFYGRIDELRISDVVRSYLEVNDDGRERMTPASLSLSGPRPNPANSGVTLTFALNRNLPVRIEAFEEMVGSVRAGTV